MSDEKLFALAAVALIAAVTLLLRALPFLLFGGKRKPPAWVNYLGRTLPFAVMGMLVVFCLRNTAVLSYPYGLPELIGCATVTLLYLWRKNSLVAILGGTAVYMVMVQFVF